MAQTLTITSYPLEISGRRAIVYGTGDANGSSTGSIATGLKEIEVAFTTITETASGTTEDVQVVKNSNNGTEGSVAGTVYFSVPDSTNSTWDWVVIGSK